jgi:hypothetical protein
VSYRVGRIDHDTSGRGSLVVSLRHGAERERHEVAGVTDARAVAALIGDDMEFRVALHSPRRLFVHAAAVAWGGHVIALPARTCAGKSTLAVELVRAGATYYSDEFAVLDVEGLVRPFTRPLRLRGRDGTPPRDIHPEELGGTAGSEALPLGLVVATTYRAGARWRPHPMSPGEVALALFANTVIARRRPAHAATLIARAVGRGATGVHGARGEAAEVAGQLLDLMERAPRSTPDARLVR